jgi:heme exporter protein C
MTRQLRDPAPVAARYPAPGSAARAASTDWVAWVAALAVVGTLIRAIFFTPLEARQGAAQKIFYLHVPAAWVAFMAFGLVAFAGLAYLWLRDERLDRFAASSAEVGLVFTTVVLLTGPIWARPIWGVWWTWDARLTSTLFLWFIYLGYIVLRGALDDRAMRARYSAILGALGALLVPFIHLSVYMFRVAHPQPVVGSPQAIGAIMSGDPAKAPLPPEMLHTLFIALAAFTLLYVAFVRARYRLAAEQDALDALGAA